MKIDDQLNEIFDKGVGCGEDEVWKRNVLDDEGAYERYRARVIAQAKQALKEAILFSLPGTKQPEIEGDSAFAAERKAYNRLVDQATHNIVKLFEEG